MTHIEKCLKAYDHVLKILEINNDNYFKRTQILMIVAQSALFVAFAKVLAVKNARIFEVSGLLTQRCALRLITFCGAVFAVLWYVFIRRQCNVLDLCKGYLRGIEKYLMQLGIPSGYWTYESKLSHPNKGGQPIVHLKIDTSFFTEKTLLLPFPLKNYDDKCLQEGFCDLLPRKRSKLSCVKMKFLKWSKIKKLLKWLKVREGGDFPIFWIALTKIEKFIALLLFAVWLLLFVLVFRSDC